MNEWQFNVNSVFNYTFCSALCCRNIFLFFSKNIQKWSIKIQERQRSLNPLSWFIRDDLYLANVQICGLIALLMAAMLFVALVKRLN